VGRRPSQTSNVGGKPCHIEYIEKKVGNVAVNCVVNRSIRLVDSNQEQT
jgi:hypothetical protein